MRPKIVRGKGFEGVLKYCLEKGKFAGMVASNMSSPTNPTALAREFGAVRRIRQECRTPVWHGILSCPPGERLSDAKWNVVVRDFLAGMGFDDRHQFVANRHDDRPHDHVHIVANRVGVDGSLWAGEFEGRLAIRVLKRLEVKHGLQLTFADEEPGQSKKPSLQQTKGEKEMYKRKGLETTPKEMLSRAIESCLRDRPTPENFSERMVRAGVDVIFNLHPTTGDVRGLTFKLQRSGKAYSGSEISKGYGWARIRQRMAVGDPIAEAVQGGKVLGEEQFAVRPGRTSFQARLIFEIYGEDLPLDTRFVRRREDGAVEFRLAGGQRMIDADTAVSLRGIPDADAIAAMLVCVEQHAWDEVQIDDGSPEFRAEFARQAAAKGIRVVGYEVAGLGSVEISSVHVDVHEMSSIGKNAP